MEIYYIMLYFPLSTKDVVMIKRIFGMSFLALGALLFCVLLNLFLGKRVKEEVIYEDYETPDDVRRNQTC